MTSVTAGWAISSCERMKIFVAGATGVLGRRLIPLLTASGHTVVGTTRTASKLEELRSAGAEPVVLDVLHRDAVCRAVTASRPDVVVQQATALAAMRNVKRFDEEFVLTNRLRTEGTQHLLAAALDAGATRFIAQSYTGWPNNHDGSRIKTEDDPLDPNPPEGLRRTLNAIRRLEQMVRDAKGITGIILRYGSFYGPGTSIASGGYVYEMLRKRSFPVVGGGAGVWSFIHIDDAAAATRLAIESGPSGIYNIVDDEPAEVSVWLPELARIIGAKPPMRVPKWIARFAIGEAGVLMMTQIRGSSNARAKRVLGWKPLYATWRKGFS